MKVLITGANGFLGSLLVDKFSKSGCNVLAVDVSFSAIKFDVNDRVRMIQSDLTNVDNLREEIGWEEADLFYHLAWKGVNGPDKSDYTSQLNNILLSLRCADLAKSLGCKKFLCAGTIAERGVDSLPFLSETSPGMMYAAAKMSNRIMLECYCKKIGLNFVWMQFSNVFGPRNKTGNIISYTLNQLKQNLPAEFGPADQPYDFIFADDLIEAVYRLGFVDNKYGFYFIGSGRPAILSDYLRIIGKVLRKPDLIQIGRRKDDHIKYSFEMLKTDRIENEIGKYVSGTFEELIELTVKNM